MRFVGTKRGTNVERAGWSMAKRPPCKAMTTYSSHSWRKLRAACNANTNDSSASAELVQQHQLSPIDCVGERATDQPDHDQRNRNGKPDRADREGGMGHRVDLHRHRDVRHLVSH